MEDLRKELQAKGIKDDDEHCVIHAMFPEQLAKIYEPKKPQPAAPAAEVRPPPSAPAAVSSPPAVAVGPGKHYRIQVDGRSITAEVQEIH
jgi:oxaloacetate decarboxylase alpha subunit/pyruvate carboxylase subunit B